MKKYLNLILAAVTTLLGACVYLLGLAPAIKANVTSNGISIGGSTIGAGSSTSTTNFYECFQREEVWGLGVAIVVVLSIGVALALALTAMLVVMKKGKNNKMIFAVTSGLAAILLIVAGVLFFFVANDVAGSSNIGNVVSASVTIGVGAIFAGIVAIVAGVVAGFNTFKLVK